MDTLLIVFQDLIPAPVILVETAHVLNLKMGTHATVQQAFQEGNVTKVAQQTLFSQLLSDSHVQGSRFDFLVYIPVNSLLYLNPGKRHSPFEDVLNSYNIGKL